MKTIICDKCRKEFDEKDKIVYVIIRKSGFVDINMDFCEKCYEKIENVIGKDKVKINLKRSYKG